MQTKTNGNYTYIFDHKIKNNVPVVGCLINFYDPILNKVLDSTITDKKGYWEFIFLTANLSGTRQYEIRFIGAGILQGLPPRGEWEIFTSSGGGGPVVQLKMETLDLTVGDNTIKIVPAFASANDYTVLFDSSVTGVTFSKTDGQYFIINSLLDQSISVSIPSRSPGSLVKV